ncbi:hypothetical protein BDN70DRAFT_771835, partial [Pholiota conissans]
KGFMHCGCFIDDVLLDFYLWKTMTITSRHPTDATLMAAKESMLGAAFPPRVRAFFVEAFLFYSHLTLKDLYSFNFGTADYDKKILMLQ